MINTVIDISHFQENIDWAKLYASGVKAVIHKSSQGSGHTDSLYHEHRLKATAAGLLWGAYHMIDSSDVGEQVKNFLKSALPDGKTLLAVQWQDLGGGSSGGSSSSVNDDHPQGEIDGGTTEPTPTPMSTSEGELEEGKQEPTSGSSSSTGGSSSGSQTASVESVRKFVELVKEQSGNYPILCSGSVAKRELGSGVDPVLKNCAFWVIQYADHPSDIPLTFGKTFALWQYTNGEVGPEPHEAPGIGPCFRDRFNGEERELAAFWSTGKAPESEKTESGSEGRESGRVTDEDDGRDRSSRR